MTARPLDPTAVLGLPCSSLVGAVGHHTYFLRTPAARARIARFCEAIRSEGIGAFLEAEYPRARKGGARGEGKAFIVNVVGGTPCLIDGNAHLMSLVLCHPAVTLAELCEAAGRDDLVRIWRAGWEEGSGQAAPYDVYIPPDTRTDRIPGARRGVDGFRQPPLVIKIVSAGIASDSLLFDEADRGRPLGQTAAALRELGVGA